jgi:hypothetical protein
MLRFFNHQAPPTELHSSKLYDRGTFSPAFLRDLNNCDSKVIIECPFITSRLPPTLEKLKAHRVRMAVNTRDSRTHDEGYWRNDAHDAVSKLQYNIGVQILYTGKQKDR